MTRWLVAIVLVALTAPAAFAQDVKTVLTNASRAMGIETLTSVRYYGAGANFTLLERLAARGESLRYHIARLLALLDDYGPQELGAAVDRALERDALGAGAIAHILETRRRQRGLKPPIPIALPARPGVRDLDVTPHRLETDDELTRSDSDDAE
jgi:hypothetical protein